MPSQSPLIELNTDVGNICNIFLKASPSNLDYPRGGRQMWSPRSTNSYLIHICNLIFPTKSIIIVSSVSFQAFSFFLIKSVLLNKFWQIILSSFFMCQRETLVTSPVVMQTRGEKRVCIHELVLLFLCRLLGLVIVFFSSSFSLIG